jgi:hypothetical protein
MTSNLGFRIIRKISAKTNFVYLYYVRKENHLMMKKTIVILIAIAMSACSSIHSIESPDKAIEGLTYYMPKKDILVTITIKEKQITAITLGTTQSYPDLSKQYVLRHGGNLLGKNVSDVTITEAGLLSTAKSETTSNVSDVFKSLATTAGMLTRGREVGEQPAEQPCADGTNSFVYILSDPSPRPKACGLDINITRLGNLDNVVPHSMTAKEEHSGIFYRQNIPYLVIATKQDITAQSVVFSPSESKNYFLPIDKTLFSNNAADFTFAEGIPTKYKQDTDGEVVALLKIPADIIGAYFDAVGNLFSKFQTKTTNETTNLTDSLKLELAKKKYDACITAINANDTEKIASLGCGQ